MKVRKAVNRTMMSKPIRRKHRRRIGPYSGSEPLARLDGRRREARLMASTRAELTAQVGGNPPPTERALIERVAWLTLHVSLMDQRAIERGELSERDSRTYLAWSNTLAPYT